MNNVTLTLEDQIHQGIDQLKSIAEIKGLEDLESLRILMAQIRNNLQVYEARQIILNIVEGK